MCEELLRLDENLRKAIEAWISEVDEEICRRGPEESIPFCDAKDRLNLAYTTRREHLQVCLLCREPAVCLIPRL